MISVIVQTQGFAFELCDESSILNTDAFWNTGTTSERRAQLQELGARGDCATHEVILDGSFKLQFEFDDMNAAQSPRRIHLRTGRMVIRSGRHMVRVATLEPGTYGVVIVWDANVESEHYDILPGQYPATDGPDGLVTLGRIAP